MLTALYHLFPPQIHPMVIHFTIAIIYLVTLTGIAGLIWRKNSTLYYGFQALLVLSILATIAAGVAGVISEYYVHIIPPGVSPILEAHKRDGEITGVILVIATIIQWFSQRKAKRIAVLAVIVCVAAMILVSATGALGGSMVYDHGLGVK